MAGTGTKYPPHTPSTKGQSSTGNLLNITSVHNITDFPLLGDAELEFIKNCNTAEEAESARKYMTARAKLTLRQGCYKDIDYLRKSHKHKVKSFVQTKSGSVLCKGVDLLPVLEHKDIMTDTISLPPPPSQQIHKPLIAEESAQLGKSLNRTLTLKPHLVYLVPCTKTKRSCKIQVSSKHARDTKPVI